MKLWLVALCAALLSACSVGYSPSEEPVESKPPENVSATAPAPDIAQDQMSPPLTMAEERAARAAAGPRRSTGASRRAAPSAVPTEEEIGNWPFFSQLSAADMAFNSPTQMQLGENVDIQLIIDPTKTSEQIKKQITAEGEKVGATIKISKVIVAKLRANDFDILELVNEGKQAVDLNGPTEWLWNIRPKSTGAHKIHLTISAVVEIDGTTKAERLIRTFDHEITVIITPEDQLKSWLKEYWQWLFSTLLLPLGMWLWKKRAA